MNFQIPIVLVCFAIICGLIHYKKMKASSEEKRLSDEFWELQNKSNHTRNKDFSDLDFFVPDKTILSETSHDIEEINYCIQNVIKSMEKPMMNLSHFSNTDLKLTYGTGNFELLSSYDDNFNSFLVYLSNLANAYLRNNLKSDAKRVFFYAINSGSVRFDDWIHLTNLYLEDNDTASFKQLKNKLNDMDFNSKASLLKELDNLSQSQPQEDTKKQVQH